MESLPCMNIQQKLSSKHGGKRNKLILMGSLITLLMVLVVTIPCLTTKLLPPKSEPSSSHQISTVSKLATVSPCKSTFYPEACESLLPSTKGSPPVTLESLFDLSIRSVVAQGHSTRSLAYNLSHFDKKLGNHQSLTAIDDCVELLDHSLGQLDSVLDHKTNPSPDDIQTWLSSALTHQVTCLEGLQSHKVPAEKDLMYASAKKMVQFISNSLAIYKSMRTRMEKSKPSGRRLLSDSFPTWVSARDRKLLEASVENIAAKAVVAKDGTGTHTTIAEALAFVSLLGAGDGRTVIHVTAGTYNENLKIPSSQKNVMLVGDGKGVTVITGSKNAEDGSSLLQTATFGATGDGFIARDITFVNSAGPSKHQAIALRLSSDRSVIYRCSIIGYQDTLYTQSNRQFYRETDIYGTVDFIFGNSAVVFQSCNIYPRKPMSDQKNFITAQGRTDPNQNTGISIHGCRIAATSDLASAKNPTFLGRPWKQYSRTVIMQSFLDGSIHPSGWFPWSGGSSPKSVYYGEYMNSGPGSSTSGRVKWPGYHPSLTTAEATGFTVAKLISGDQWLPSTGISFDSGLHA